MAYDVSRGTVYARGHPTPRELRDRFADVVNVKDFGARGDGVTDDTAALNAAVAAGFATGKPVYVPIGVYITDGIVLRTGQRLIGEAGVGATATWLVAHPELASTLKGKTAETVVITTGPNPSALDYGGSIEIYNLCILGYAGANTYPPHVSAGYTAWATGTHYTVGTRRATVRGDVYEVTGEGDSAGTGTGPKQFDAAIADGTVTWKYVPLGHGIYAHSFPFGVHIEHVTIAGMPGKGILTVHEWTSQFGPFIHFDACADNLLEMSGGNTTKVDTVYFHRVAAGKAGLRMHGGRTTLLNVNGIDGSQAGAHWGVFGDTVADDGVVNSYAGNLIGCNVESFQGYGIWLKAGSIADLHSVTFWADHANTVALQLDAPSGGMVIDATNAFGAYGAGSYKDGQAIHGLLGPPMAIGVVPGVWQNASLGNMYWNDTNGRAEGVPTIGLVSGGLHLTATHFADNGWFQTFSTGLSRILTHGAQEFSGLTWSASPVADGAVATADIATAVADKQYRYTAYFRDQYLPAGVIMQASCPSAGHVTVTLFNKTGGNYTPPTGILYLEIWAH